MHNVCRDFQIERRSVLAVATIDGLLVSATKFQLDSAFGFFAQPEVVMSICMECRYAENEAVIWGPMSQTGPKTYHS